MTDFHLPNHLITAKADDPTRAAHWPHNLLRTRDGVMIGRTTGEDVYRCEACGELWSIGGEFSTGPRHTTKCDKSRTDG